MLMTLGKDAKARLTAIAAGKAPPEPNKAVAEAQAAAAARDLFFYLDVTPRAGRGRIAQPTNSGWWRWRRAAAARFR